MVSTVTPCEKVYDYPHSKLYYNTMLQIKTEREDKTMKQLLEPISSLCPIRMAIHLLFQS